MKTVAYRYKQLVYSQTCLLVNSQKGYLAFHAPPYGGGVGGEAFFLQQTLSKYRILNILLMLEDEAGNNSAE